MYKALLPTLAGHEAVLIVIALGLNDSQIAFANVDFKASYVSLADELAPFAQKLLFVGITPIERDRPLAKRSFDPNSRPLTIKRCGCLRGIGRLGLSTCEPS
jgi:hypothetical protein